MIHVTYCKSKSCWRWTTRCYKPQHTTADWPYTEWIFWNTWCPASSPGERERSTRVEFPHLFPISAIFMFLPGAWACVCGCDCLEWVCNSVCGFQATYKALVIALAKLQNKNGRTKVCFHNSTSRAYFFIRTQSNC